MEFLLGKRTGHSLLKQEVVMKLFKKIAVQVCARAEAMANQLENKEALSLSYIREYERVVTKAKVKLAQVDAEVRRLEQEADRLEAQAALWADRARRVHAADESKALACVKRMQQEQAAHDQVMRELEETKNLKHKMVQDVDQVLAKLTALKSKHRHLSGRQSCAQAAAALQDGESFMEQGADDLFARWESDVIAQELHAQSAGFEMDRLAEEFDAAEQEQALRMTLADLLSSPREEQEVPK
jgi:phage shock protein A